MLRRFADLVVASEVPLDDLPASSGAADITIRRAAIPDAPRVPVQDWSDETGDWLTIERTASDYLLRFPELCCVVAGDGSRVDVDASPALSETELAHLLLHQVLPLAVSRRGRLVLHACAVETPRGTIGLLGQSGAGKSTLAAAFCRHGCSLVADDALVIDLQPDGVLAWPTADGLRLWEDMAAALPAPAAPASADPRRKRRIPAPLSSSPSALASLLLLGEGAPGLPRILHVPPADARVELLSHLFRLDVTDADESRRFFGLAHDLAERVAVRRLKFPDGVEFLDPTVRAVLRDLETP